MVAPFSGPIGCFKIQAFDWAVPQFRKNQPKCHSRYVGGHLFKVQQSTDYVTGSGCQVVYFRQAMRRKEILLKAWAILGLKYFYSLVRHTLLRKKRLTRVRSLVYTNKFLHRFLSSLGPLFLPYVVYLAE